MRSEVKATIALVGCCLVACTGNGRMADNKVPASSGTAIGPTTVGGPATPTTLNVSDISALPDGQLAAFARLVWAPTASQDCLACHISHGYAPSHGAAFELQPASQDGYLSNNMAAFTSFATRQINGKSYLLQKATNTIAHGGGQRLLESDVRYNQMAAWIESPAGGQDLQLTDDKLATVQQLDAVATLRKAAAQLAQRTPTAQEVALAAGGNLDAALDTVLSSENFGTFVWGVYNDMFFMSDFLAGNLVASDRMDGNLFTQNQRYWWAVSPYNDSANEHGATEDSLGHQAENLARYLVMQNLPFTQLVTANYFMANPDGAMAYGAYGQATWGDANSPAWSDPNRQSDFQPISASSVVTANGVSLPMSGVLTLQSYMNTFPTTGSNRNRKRARFIYQLFLNTDIMKLAQNPPDLAKIIASSDPNQPATMVNYACVSCHTLLDQVAGTFANWDNYGTFYTDPNAPFGPATMFAAGLEGQPVDASAANRLAWLGQKIVSDPRFAAAIVSQWFTPLTGMPLLSDPASGATLQEDTAAKIYQDQLLASIAQQFTNSNYNLKSVVKGIVQSPYYRSLDVTTALTASDARMLDSLVSYHWRGAKDLSAALQTSFGTPWVTDRLYGDTLTQEYPALMTGNDATGFGARLTTFMGSDMACFAFYSQRYGYYEGDAAMLPQTILDAPDPDSTTGGQTIQNAIGTLVDQIFPLSTAIAGAEKQAAWELYTSVYQTALASPNDTPTGCIGGRLADNVVATRQAWMAVLTYLITDPDLLFE